MEDAILDFTVGREIPENYLGAKCRQCKGEFSSERFTWESHAKNRIAVFCSLACLVKYMCFERRQW